MGFVQDIGGWLWLVIDVAMVAVLAIALLFASRQWRRRRFDREADARRDAAVRRNYDNEP